MKRSREARKQDSPVPKRKQGTRRPSRPAGGRRKPAISGDGGGEERYWMRCPRCGMGLIETVKGAITTERCTACGAVWADREDVERAWSEGTPQLFRPFRQR